MGKTIDLKTKIPWCYAAGLPGEGPWDAMTPRHNLNGINLIKVSALATLNQVQCLKILLVSYCLLSSTDSACLRISLQPAKVPIVLSDSGNLAPEQDEMTWTDMAYWINVAIARSKDKIEAAMNVCMSMTSCWFCYFNDVNFVHIDLFRDQSCGTMRFQKWFKCYIQCKIIFQPSSSGIVRSGTERCYI